MCGSMNIISSSVVGMCGSMNIISTSVVGHVWFYEYNYNYIAGMCGSRTSVLCLECGCIGVLNNCHHFAICLLL